MRVFRPLGRGRRGSILALLLVLVAAGACAPRLAPPGNVAVQPQISATAFVTADGLSLPARAWLPDGEPRAVILALHGFNDYSNAFENPGRILAAQGYAVHAYDQRGFGEAPHRGLWPGSGRLTGDLTDATGALRQRYPGRLLYLLGESMGAAVILAGFAGGDPPPADGVILSAPAVWARSTMPFYQRVTLWLSAHTIPWARFSGSGLKIQASDNIEMLRALGRDPLVIKETRVDAIHGLVDLMDEALAAAPKLTAPALLLYGEKDEIVPRDPTLELWRSLPGLENPSQRPALYDNGWHMLLRDLDAGLVLADIAQWIEDRETPLPSGADRRAREALNAPDADAPSN